MSSDDSDQLGHPPSLVKVMTVHMKKYKVIKHTVKNHQTGSLIPSLIGVLIELIVQMSGSFIIASLQRARVADTTS